VIFCLFDLKKISFLLFGISNRLIIVLGLDTIE